MSWQKYIVVPIFFCSFVMFGQNNPEVINNYIENLIEQTISTSEGTTNIESIVSDLEYIFSNPINLNRTNAEELDKLWILNDFQIISLLDYRKKMGGFVSIYELNYIYAFDEKTVELIRPFIYLGESNTVNHVSVKDIVNNLNHEILLRTSQQKPSNENWSENNQKYYARYKAWYKNRINIGFIAEKDAGEDFFGRSNPTGFDYYSGYIQYNGRNALKTLILGDYRVRAGQGLLIWPGYSSGKSSQITSVQKRGQGISGNTSADEYGYFRGGGLELGKKKFLISLFGSNKQLDASFNSLREGITSIRTDGLHRTNTEKMYEKNTSEQLYGAKINLVDKHFQWGLNYLNISYSNPILPGVKTYQHYNFNGQNYAGISSDYKILFQRLQFYGEVAYANKGLATINAINLMPHPQFLTSLIYRGYQKNYFSPYSNAMAENSSATNEEGLYGGLQWNTDWNISISAYADVFSFPWAKYGIDGSSNGKEYLLETAFNPRPEIEFKMRYKYQEKSKNYTSNEDSEMSSLTYLKKKSIRMHLWYLLSAKVSMSTRFELNQSGYLKDESKPGYLLYQDILFKPTSKMQFNFRHTWFDISDYNSRIYTYESSARYVYSMPAYYAKGTKTYLVIRYNVSKWLSVWLRYSYLNYFNKDEEEIPNKQEGLLQILMRF